MPGVTSISTDLHKYGYAARGCSVIMYRSKDIRKFQILACTDTTAYTLTNPTVLSTKSGGPMAGAWAMLNFLDEVLDALPDALCNVFLVNYFNDLYV